MRPARPLLVLVLAVTLLWVPATPFRGHVAARAGVPLPRHIALQAGVRLRLRVAAQAVVPITVTLRHVDVVPLDATGDITHEELFIFVDVHYSGSDVWRLYSSDFALMDAEGVPQYPQSYSGADPLQSTNLVQLPHAPPAHAGGWLRFTIAKSAAKGLSLVYLETVQESQGPARTVVAADLAVPVGPPNRRRVYATLAMAALHTYLIDEALAAGDVLLNVDPLYAQGGDGPIPGAILARLQRELGVLVQDHKVLDGVPAPGPDAQALQSEVDQACDAIENSLSTIGTVRTAAEWVTWRAAFALANTTLGALYQTWPAAE